MSSTFRPSAPSKHTVVEEGSSFKGTLTSTCPIHVHGRIEGDLETPALTVSATGAVHGRVKVGAVRSQGELSGEFDADSVELAGTVRDNTVIRARSLEVKLASTRGKLQVIFGECELSVGDEPTEHDAVEPMAAPAEVAAAAMPMLAAEATPPVVEPPATPMSAEQAPMGPSDPLTLAILAATNSASSDEESDEEDEDGDEDAPANEGSEAEALEVRAEGQPGKRRRRRRQNDADPAKTGWSQPPSQPPPGS